MHFDCPINPNTARNLDILQTFNLEQAVSQPTHQRGHILDWILYREEERLLLSCIVKHGVSSDHLPVLCYLDVSRPKQQSVFQTTRNIRAIDTGLQSRRVHLSHHSGPTYCRPTERSAARPFGPTCPGDKAQGAPATTVSMVQRCRFTATCLEVGETTC